MKIQVAVCAFVLASSATLGCSRSEAPPTAPAAAPPSGANEQARADLEKATQELQVDDALQKLPAAGESPAAMSEEDMAEARKAIEGMLESVKKELEEKAVALGEPADPNAPASPAVPAAPTPVAPRP